MQATYNIRPHELNEKFLLTVQKLFHSNSKLVISIREEIDETDYLMSSENNKMALEESITQYRNGETITFNSIEEIQLYVDEQRNNSAAIGKSTS